ncbi:MAG TPA: hypothetical protein VGN69_01685 [Solirubrobacteraceae bacterium]|nr:hypothetical protein [Solirubrobacteraceae bacterium]
MTPPISTSRFLLLPEERLTAHDELKPRIRRFRLARVGTTGLPVGRSSGFAHLREMHD